MKLTAKNYFSKEANLYYMSNSQYKSFLECEEKTIEELNGRWPTKELLEKFPDMFKKDYFLQGHYVDAWNNGDLEKFKAETPELYKKDGTLYKKYSDLDDVIETIKKDELMMKSLSGQKQVIFTAKLFGIPWKIMIDSYAPEERRICDLKVLKSIKDKFWVPEEHRYMNVFEYRGYYTQMGTYPEIERLANKRKKDDYYEPFLTIATKDEIPDKSIISFNSTEESHVDFIIRQLNYVENHIERIKAVKSGQETPIRCNTCEYCRSTKQLTGTTHYSDFEY